MRAGPFDDTAAPPDLVALGESLVPVWRNELGGLTFRGVIGTEQVFVKWAQTGVGLNLADERDRMLWAIAYAPVPVVLDYRESADGEVLVTRAIPAESAVSDHWLVNPAAAVRGLAVGLRRWHDALPVADRWADIAVAARNTALNYGPGWEPAFLEAYGVDPDPNRQRYYLELWDRT